jgi:hypothetical protein
MQSQRLRDTLQALRGQAGYVVIEAPSTSSSADAQSLASLADAAILAVELRRAHRPALLDAAEQLRRVGTPLLGAVVLPRLTGLRPPDAHLPAVALTPQVAEDGPRPDETAVLDTDRTQAVRLPGGARPALAGRPSPGPVRPRPSDADDATAVIEMTPMSTDQPTDGKPNGER